METGKTARRFRHRVTTAGRLLLGREWAGRNLTILHDDVYLVSYPKSGSTWLRFLIGNLIYPNSPVTFANVESLLPNTDLHSDSTLLKAPKPRIMKSQEPFFTRYPRVIYVVRDPRDVAVSYFHYLVKFREFPDGFTADQFVPLFIKGDYLDAERHGPWGDHVMSWVKMRQGADIFLLLRYEDLLADPQRELGRVAKFLGIAAAPDRLAQAVEMSSAPRMRNLEKAQWRLWKATRKSRGDKPFVRSAAAGGWRRELSESSVAAIESAWGDAMRALGYSLLTEGVRTETGTREILT